MRCPYLCAIADHADLSQFRLQVATLAPAGPLHQDMRARGISCFALDCTRRAHYPLAVWRLATYLRRQRVDILQTHLFDAGLVGLVAARLAGTQLVIETRHHADAVVLTGKLLPFLIDRLCSRLLCHRVITLSERARHFLRVREGLPGGKVVAIPLGFDFQRLQPTPGGPTRVREEFALRDGIVLGSVGRLDPLKGHRYLFEALAQLVPAYPHVHLLIVGDGPERQKLEALCKDLRLERHVTFTGHRSDVLDVLGATDMLVHPSLSECFNQVIIEACALGKPVLATAVGAAQEVIEHGKTGLIVRPGHADDLRDGLKYLFARRQEWQSMGHRGRQRVEQFTARRMVTQYEANYIKWLEERRRT
jgi:glycosyltransferase involved in cell wall biosynthesis